MADRLIIHLSPPFIVHHNYFLDAEIFPPTLSLFVLFSSITMHTLLIHFSLLMFPVTLSLCVLNDLNITLHINQV